MRRTEQTIIGVVAVIGLIVGFWLVVLSPKRDEASKLEEEVSSLRSSLDQAQLEVANGEDARDSFRIDYRRLVVLGKAVPADSEQASLLVQLQKLAERSGVEFQALNLAESSSSGSATTPAPTTTPSTTEGATVDASTTSSSSEVPVGSAPAVATEASAAALPIGASIGPAGLPIMPYDLTFTGDFFEIADFMQRLDGMVHMREGLVDVNGRLLTVNGFSLQPIDTELDSTPELTVDLNVTTYVTPADQGITAGATPTGPVPATPALTSGTETSAPTTDTTATPTATATP